MKDIQKPIIRKYISLKNYTTWKVGGKAEYFAEPNNFSEIKAIINWAKRNHITCELIGAGSNLLISDLGVPGLSLCLRKLHGLKIDANSGLIEANAGEPIPALARRAARAGLQGLEWSVGIPGTVGGASVMNAGAQGGCIAESLQSVLVMPLDGKESFELTNKDLRYAYRHSLLQEEKLIVLSAKFKLDPGHSISKLTRITNENLNHRKSTQPYHLPSCGSVFRNPEPFKAGKLIEEVGLKGHHIGGASVSTMHANFIVNNGEASSKDLQELIRRIKALIYETYGFQLITEVKSLGSDSST